MQRRVILLVHLGGGLAPLALALAAFLYARGFPDPPGVTGYYYLKQIEVLASQGRFFFADRSAAFLLPAVLSYLTKSSLDAYRLAVALTWSALVTGIVLLAFGLAGCLGAARRQSLAAAALAGLLACASVTLLELAFNFYKNLLGAALLVWAAAVACSPFVERRRGQLLAGALVLGALLCHKSAFLLAALVLGAWVASHASRRSLLLLAAGAAGLLLLFLVLFEKSQHYLLALVGLLDTPASWALWLGSVPRRDPVLVLLLASGGLVLVLYALFRQSLPRRARVLLDAAAALLLICLHPFQRAGPEGAAYRMILLSPVCVISLLLACSVSRAGQDPPGPRGGLRRVLGGIVALLLLAQPLVARDRTAGFFPRWSALDSEIEKIAAHVRPRDHLIAHHGMETYIGYRTGIRAKHYLPDRPGQRVFRVAYVPEGRPGGEARDELEMVMLARIGKDYALLREQDWQEISTRFAIRPHWRNPAGHRPAHVHQ